MKYMGSKARIAKYIVPIIQNEISDIYIEPFCGGCNVIDKIVCDTRIASDINPYLIALLKAVAAGIEIPDTLTREEYNLVRSNMQNYEKWQVGAVGFLGSYNGRFFDGGYGGIAHTKAGTIRNYYAEARGNLLKQNLNGIIFKHRDYRELKVSKAVIYCDPPYGGMKQYRQKFDHVEFWDVMRQWSKSNIVFISEHAAPSDFETVWEQPITRTIDNTKRVQTIERLFRWKGPKEGEEGEER